MLSGDAGRLRSELRDLGAAGALVLVGLMLVHAVVPFPSELVNAAAGFVYGFWLALPLVLAGWTAVRARHLRDRPRRRAAAAAAARGRGAAGGGLAADRARRPDRAARRAADPDRALQPRRLRRRRRASAAVALRVDDGRRLDPAVRRGRLPRRPARLAVARPTPACSSRRRVPGAADRRPRAGRARPRRHRQAA